MRRVLLKLSGEALSGNGRSIDPDVVSSLALEVKALLDGGHQLAVVLGGGNLFRGAELQASGMDRVTADHMGMLATVMNGLAFRDLLSRHHIATRLFSAFEIPGVATGYSREAAVAALTSGEVTIFTAGTGNPFFTTDTAACLRAIEVDAEMVLKATKVDGVYTADPAIDPRAERFESLSYDEVLERHLGVMDLTAISLCKDHDMPLVVFDMRAKGALTAIINGDKVGTQIIAGAKTAFAAC